MRGEPHFHAEIEMAGIVRPRSVALVLREYLGRVGGTERVLTVLANALVGAGHRVTVLYWDKSEVPPAFPLAPGVRRENLFRPTLAERLYPCLTKVPYWRLRHRLQHEIAHGPFRRALAR